MIDLVQRGTERAQLVALTREVGDVGVGKHPAAVGQRDAFEPGHGAIGHSQLDRRGISRAHERDALRDEFVQLVGLDRIAGVRRGFPENFVVGRMLVRPALPQAGALEHRPVHELRAQILVQHDHAVVDLIERDVRYLQLAVRRRNLRQRAARTRLRIAE